MNQRANYQKLAPASTNALFALEKTMAESPLDHGIINLVKIRVSQLNGCLFCLDMHMKEARRRDERELRLHHLPLWRESSLFSAKEKAALEWAELLTQPDAHGVEDEDYEALVAHFDEKEIADLTFAVAIINTWNRLGIAFRPTPGALDKLLGLDKIGMQ